MTDTQTLEIVNALRSLPPDKFAEVKDFILFLRDRYSISETIDESDAWSAEDLQDVTAASIDYSEKTAR